MVFVAGQVPTAAELNAEIAAGFPVGLGAWPSYVPTLTQGGAVTKTVQSARYFKVGRWVHVEVYLVATGAGTANNRVLVGLPVTPSAASLASGGAGHVWLYDQTAGQQYTGMSFIASATTMAFFHGGTGTVSLAYGQTGAAGFAVALANADQIIATLDYESAS